MWLFILIASLESLDYTEAYQSTSPAKLREKPPDNAENRITGCGERENSFHSLRMLRKREGGPLVAISISWMAETPPTKYLSSYLRNHSRPQRPRSFWSAPRIATSCFTAVKRLGTRVNTRVIYALPVTFPLHPTKFPRSTSATRAISVLSSIIQPLQTLFSRVLLLRQQPF